MWNSPLGEESHSLALQPRCKSAHTGPSCWESLPWAALWPELGWELPTPALHSSGAAGQDSSEFSLYPLNPTGDPGSGEGRSGEKRCWDQPLPFQETQPSARLSESHRGVWRPGADSLQDVITLFWVTGWKSVSLPRLQKKGVFPPPTATTSLW